MAVVVSEGVEDAPGREDELGVGLGDGFGWVESRGIGTSDGSSVGVVSGTGSLLAEGRGVAASVGEEFSSAITGATRESIAPTQQRAKNLLARTLDFPEAM